MRGSAGGPVNMAVVRTCPWPLVYVRGVTNLTLPMAGLRAGVRRPRWR